LNLGNWVYEFTPVQDSEEGPITVKVNVIRENVFLYQDVKSLSQKEKPPNYYVVDPYKTKDNCDIEDANKAFTGKFILVSSPDSCHWGGSEFEKAEKTSRQGVFLYFPLWDLDELLAARPYINNDISDDEVKQRYFYVGGVPSNVFAGTKSYTNVVAKQKEDMKLLTKDQLKEISSCGWDVVSTFSEQLKSAIMGYGRSGIDYSKKNLQCISKGVLQSIFITGRSIVWAEYCQISDNKSDVKRACLRQSVGISCWAIFNRSKRTIRK
jgi:hypothetical protein